MLKFEGPAPTRGRDIVSRKMQFGWVQTHIQFSVVSGAKFTELLWFNAGGIADQHVFPILDILTHSGDIRDRSLKLSEIALNFACFWTQISLGGGPPNFWTCIIKFTQTAITWQNFTAIGRSSEISWRKKKTSAVKHKAFRTNVPGGLISNN